jgi:hypothetical protein
MTTAIDTNVIIALWDSDPTLSNLAQSALDEVFRRGHLVVAGPVFAELMADPGRSEVFVTSFLDDTGIAVDWSLDSVWKTPDGLFNCTLKGDVNNATLAPGGFLRTF